MPNGTRDMLRMFTYFCTYFTHLLICVHSFILGKQYKKKRIYTKKSQHKKNLNMFEERQEGGHHDFKLTIDIICAVFTRFDASRDESLAA